MEAHIACSEAVEAEETRDKHHIDMEYQVLKGPGVFARPFPSFGSTLVDSHLAALPFPKPGATPYGFCRPVFQLAGIYMLTERNRLYAHHIFPSYISFPLDNVSTVSNFPQASPR